MNCSEPPFDQQSLIAALCAGEERACEQIVRDHHGRLLVLARRMLGTEDDAADAVQDTFIAAAKAIRNFRGDADLTTWLHRIAVNVCLMKLRSKRRRPTVSLDELLPKFDSTGHHQTTIQAWKKSPIEQLCTDELRMQVRECIEKLPEDYRAVLLLRDIEELDTAETARMLSISPGAVKTRLHRARLALRTLLTPLMVNQPSSISFKTLLFLAFY